MDSYTENNTSATLSSSSVVNREQRGQVPLKQESLSDRKPEGTPQTLLQQGQPEGQGQPHTHHHNDDITSCIKQQCQSPGQGWLPGDTLNTPGGG